MWTRGSWRIRAFVILLLTSAACGGGGYSAPTSPSPTTTPTGSTSGSTVTVDIVSSAGPQAFTPNPANQTQGTTIAWRNRDGVVHRIVANDGTFDTGDIAAGATSRTIDLAAAGTNYHSRSTRG